MVAGLSKSAIISISGGYAEHDAGLVATGMVMVFVCSVLRSYCQCLEQKWHAQDIIFKV